MILGVVSLPPFLQAQTTEGKFVVQVYYTESEIPNRKIKINLSYFNNTGSPKELVQARWVFFYNPAVLTLIPSGTGSMIYNGSDVSSGLNDASYLTATEHNNSVAFYDMSPDTENPVYTGFMNVPVDGGGGTLPKNFMLMEYQRSTSLCNNIVIVPGNTAKVIYKLAFEIKPGIDIATYKLNEPESGYGTSRFIAEYILQDHPGNNWPVPTNEFKEIVFVKYHDLDLLRPRKHTGGCDAGSTVTNSTTLTMGYNEFEVANPGLVLPIRFRSFDLRKTPQGVILNWQTEMESNCKGYTVERAGNKMQFKTMALVNSVAAGGNSEGSLSYNYTDPTPAAGTYFYRIKQIDWDGTYQYSEIRAVTIGMKNLTMKIFPNPCNTDASVVIPAGTGNWQVVMTDLYGRILKQWNGAEEQVIRISGLSAGMYFLRLSLKETTETIVEKMVVK
jgi:hypothetical protein